MRLLTCSNSSVVSTLLLAGTALLAGSMLRIAISFRDGWSTHRDRLKSLVTWWVLLGVLAAAVLLGPLAVALLLGVFSILGLMEYRWLCQAEATPATWGIVYTMTAIHYAAAASGVWLGPWVLLPVGLTFIIATFRVLVDQPTGFVRDVGTILLGVTLIAFCPSHAVLLFHLPTDQNPVGGGAGWFLFLVLTTAINDIAQALWGRQFGRHPITPWVSPRKTWEGFLLGGLTTLLVAIGLAPRLTPWGTSQGGIGGMVGAGSIGLLIAISGFMGDITVSAIKRDRGVKDSSHILPGQGGVLDRMDSLIFAAPLFYYLLRMLP